MSRVSEINERIRAGTAIVRTLEQLREDVCSGAGPRDAEIAVLAFVTGISGTAAMLCVPVAERGVFTRASGITLNGVRGHPGPAPNERLGVVDALVFADECAGGDTRRYDGAALFLDLLGGSVVEVECRAVEGTTHRSAVRLESIEFARLYVYNAAFPPGPAVPEGVLDSLRAGTCIVLNGSPGILVGSGTRHRPDVPAFSLAADLRDMDAGLMRSSHSGRPQHTLALALPVRDAAMTSELVAWANSDAGAALLAPPALDAAARLQRWVQDGRFLLSETGIPELAARG